VYLPTIKDPRSSPTRGPSGTATCDEAPAKYFTLDWRRGSVPGDTVERYWPYIDSVRNSLPADLLLLLDNVSLHDAKLRWFDIDVSSRCLTIRLEGYIFRKKVSRRVARLSLTTWTSERSIARPRARAAGATWLR
jgi:hypothetical protein